MKHFSGPVQVCAFQMEAVHEDLAAGFFREFDANGLHCNGYFNARIEASRGNYFSILKHRNVKVDFVPMEGRPAWEALAAAATATAPELLFFNTFQREGIAQYAKRFDLPILGVVHNPFLFEKTDTCRELAREGRLEIFGLAPHVVETLLDRVPELDGHAHIHYPYHWMPDDAPPYALDADTLDIVIPGAVDFGNRDFEGLLAFLSKSAVWKERSIKFSILAGGPDRARLEREIEERHIADAFDLAPLDPRTKRVMQDVYLSRLHRCHAVMPLLPHGRQDYLSSKITTGIPAAIGSCKPIITSAEVGVVYGFTPIEVPAKRPFDLAGADLSRDTLSRRQVEISAVKESGFAHNSRSMREILRRRLKS